MHHAARGGRHSTCTSGLLALPRRADNRAHLEPCQGTFPGVSGPRPPTPPQHAPSPLVQGQDGVARCVRRVWQALPGRVLHRRKLLLAPHLKERGGGGQREGVENEELQLDALCGRTRAGSGG